MIVCENVAFLGKRFVGFWENDRCEKIAICLFIFENLSLSKILW